MSKSSRRALLRRIRQEKRAALLEHNADLKYVSDSVAHNFIIFGGDIADHKKNEAKHGQRSTRIMRAIRKYKRDQEAKSKALRGLRHA